ncbi:MAG: hypothetical protein BHV69_09705 [Bacteroidales bacterium 52_46]|nr:MAG: hypothetical protein BHV69_09705 [Bacteroidales bacterium 52_46]
MKKVQTKQQLTESLHNLHKLLKEDGTTVFYPPIVPSDCRSYDQATADYIRDQRLRLYLKSWVIPNIEKAISELSK